MGRKPLSIDERKRREAEYYREWVAKQPRNEYLRRLRESVNRHHKDLRLSVLRAYGGDVPKCACCGESELAFLCIDHIEGNGLKHRKEVVKNKGSMAFYRWLKKNGYPSGFQVLCYNCNMAKSILGVCPHKEAQNEVILLNTV
jgi:hypothetical protein